MLAQIAYTSLLPIAEEVHRQAWSALAAFASKNDYLAAHRIKKFDSLLEKLQSGRYKSIHEIDDFVAFSIIIDTRDQEPEVRSFLKKAFKVVSIKGENTITDERLFSFAVTRVYARLATKDSNSPLSSFTFEIQIRTLLQHAWSKITHSKVYKSAKIDMRRSRLASEILAQLENIDRSFSRFATTSKGVKRIKREQAIEVNLIIELIEDLINKGAIPPEFSPSNGRRLGENIRSVISRKVSTQSAIKVIRDFLQNLSGGYPRSLTVFELCIVALHQSGMLRPPSAKCPLYISDELLSLYPECASLEPRVGFSD